MDLPNILKQLNNDLANLNATIQALEQMEVATTRRRGRPPKWLIEAKRLSGSKSHGRVGRPRKPAGG